MNRADRAIALYMKIEGCSREQFDMIVEKYPDLEERAAVALKSLHQKVGFLEEPRECDSDEAKAEKLGKAAMIRWQIEALDAPEVEKPEAAPEPPSNVIPLAPPTKTKRGGQKPKINHAQVWGRAKRRQQQDEATGAHYCDGGFGRLPNQARHLIASMSSACAKAYMVCCLQADKSSDPEKSGRFRISAESMAEWTGSDATGLDAKGNKLRRFKHAERAMTRLADAGMIEVTVRGSRKASSEYRMLPMTKLNIEAAKAILLRPLSLKRTTITGPHRPPDDSASQS